MKNKWIVAVHILVVFGVAWGLGYTQASGKTLSAAGDGPAEAAGNVSGYFNYQGVLKENGAPVTGTRSMTFGAYHDAGCPGSAWETYGPVDVSVNNGLFNAPVNLAGEFSGWGIWLGVTINGTLVGCQEVLPVPYALSLRPGANIVSNDTGSILNIQNSGSGLYSNGISASSSGTGASAVEGTGYTPATYGVRGTSYYGNGVGVFSDGDFYRTADSNLLLSPHALISRDSAGLTLKPQSTGAMRIDASGAGTYYVTLPISTFSSLFGSTLYIKYFQVCYHVVSGAKISATQVLKWNGASGYTFYINNVADLTSTSIQCYDSTASTPYESINRSSWVQFTLTFTSASTVYIDQVMLTLSEQSN